MAKCDRTKIENIRPLKSEKTSTGIDYQFDYEGRVYGNCTGSGSWPIDAGFLAYENATYLDVGYWDIRELALQQGLVIAGTPDYIQGQEPPVIRLNLITGTYFQGKPGGFTPSSAQRVYTIIEQRVALELLKQPLATVEVVLANDEGKWWKGEAFMREMR